MHDEEVPIIVFSPRTNIYLNLLRVLKCRIFHILMVKTHEKNSMKEIQEQFMKLMNFYSSNAQNSRLLRKNQNCFQTFKIICLYSRVFD